MKALNQIPGGVTGILLKIFAVFIVLFLIFNLILWCNFITHDDYFGIIPNYAAIGYDDYLFAFTAMLATCILTLLKILIYLDTRQK